jgi:hypothetical protein
MRYNKIRENIDPKPFIRATEPGSWCLMSWDGPCLFSPSNLFDVPHDCDVVEGHKGPHRCECGKSKRLADDDPQWGDE